MAESFIFSIANSLISKVASRALEEASQVLGVYHHLQRFKHTLFFVEAVLSDADQRQEHDHQVQEWLRQLKRIFFDAEDVLDDFECQTLRKQVVKTHGTTKDKVSHFFSTSNSLVFRHKMTQQIKDITNRLHKVASDRHNFDLPRIDAGSGTRVMTHSRVNDSNVIGRMTHSRVNDSDVIGREHDKEKIIQLLVQQNSNDDDISLSVVPIVGMGGLGKTTLAKFVFNDKRIKECFPLKMWVCVSDDFDIKQLIIKVINSANDSNSADSTPLQQNLNMLDVEQLQNQLLNKLTGQKFLLVLDDVWNDELVRWVDFKNLIQVGAPCSQILVTTRNHAIASMMGTVSPYCLEGLSQEDSLSLFIKWAFKEGQEEKYSHLVDIGRKIVKKCGGVPLAVRTLGSSLFSKFEANEWKYVRDNEIWNLSQRNDGILPALKLSYDLMPSYLKQCFALFSLYPKDYQFENFKITSLWGALGLLGSPKTFGNQYLDELLSRSFLQDFVNLGGFYVFKIHDLVHDLAKFVAQDECLLISHGCKYIPQNIRHVSFAENILLDNLFTTESVSVRTVLFPNGTAGANNKAFVNSWLSKFKYLRYLNLSCSAYETLPRSICKLKHLRHLDISGNRKIKRLPESICKLQNLQELLLGECIELEALPRGLRKLISLRQFEITTKESVLPYNEITNLSSLQIAGCVNLESTPEEVKFPTLKTLNVSRCPNLKSFPLDVKSFPELETLIVENCDNLILEQSNDDDEEQSSTLKLKTVQLSDLPQLVALPEWLKETANSLHTLLILNCNNLEMLPDWLSTLTNLKVLMILHCPNLIDLPGNIDLLTSLERLEIGGCPQLCRKCEPQVGEFWPKIAHIEDIDIQEPED